MKNVNNMFLKKIILSKRIGKIFAVSLISLMCMDMSAQTLEQARGYIGKKEYHKAAESFEVLIKRYPNRPDVNKWYGQALFEIGKKEEAVPFLLKAAKGKITGSYPYLGEYYFENYQFNKAVDYFTKYKASLKPAEEEEMVRVKELLSKAELAERALSKVEKVEIIDSIVVGRNNFFRNYMLGNETGRLLDYDVTGLGNDPENLVFETQRGDRRLFGKSNDSLEYNIYYTGRLLGDSWSEPMPLKGGINSESNDNYPFALTDGMTVYFASDRDGGIGGYDLYVSKYSPEREMYLQPERLPMPFNSPYNDYMMAIDEDMNVGWFASDRFQPEDSVVIYVFIPNAQRVYYEKDLPDTMENLAKINSIKSTWNLGSNYRDILSKIYELGTVDNTRKAVDFVFIVNDKNTYYHLSDFKDAKAKELYKKIIAVNKALNDNADQLNKLRNQWSSADNNRKSQLRTEILKLEDVRVSLLNNIDQTENEVRKAELPKLR